MGRNGKWALGKIGPYTGVFPMDCLPASVIRAMKSPKPQPPRQGTNNATKKGVVPNSKLGEVVAKEAHVVPHRVPKVSPLKKRIKNK